jgi:hypothetical protein
LQPPRTLRQALGLVEQRAEFREMLGDALGHEIWQARCADLARLHRREANAAARQRSRRPRKERVIDGRVRAEGKCVDE